MAGVDFRWLAGGLGALLLVLVAKKRRARTAAACCTAAMGFTLIGLEMLLLLGFQAIYGYVYQQLAVIIAAFMAGMALGSWLALRAAARRGYAPWCTCRLALRLRRCCSARCSRPSPRRRFRYWPSLRNAGGYEFPVASRIFCARNPGTLYALDLAGACVGAVLFSVYLIRCSAFSERRCWLRW